MNLGFKLVIILFFGFQIYAQSLDDFQIFSRKDTTSVYLIALNNIPSSMTLEITDNSSGKVYQKLIIPPKDSLMFLKHISVDHKNYLNQINSKYKLSYNFGDSLSSKHNDNYLYDFPFSKKRKYKLIQGWGGYFSHKKPKSYHALDFKMKIGEPVHAARAGIVVRSVEKYKENGGIELSNFANVIIIKHDDNTFAHYVHLKPHGSLVEVGQKVEKGDLIGYSGNTGFSTRPHLHFVVRDGTGNSVPVYFKKHKNKKLKVNKTYKG